MADVLTLGMYFIHAFEAHMMNLYIFRFLITRFGLSYGEAHIVSYVLVGLIFYLGWHIYRRYRC